MLSQMFTIFRSKLQIIFELHAIDEPIVYPMKDSGTKNVLVVPEKEHFFTSVNSPIFFIIDFRNNLTTMCSM